MVSQGRGIVDLMETCLEVTNRPLDTLGSAPFTELLAALDDLPRGSLEAEHLGVALQDALEGRVVSRKNLSWQHIRPRVDLFHVGSMLQAYRELPPEKRNSAEERSNDLMLLKPAATSRCHELVWRSPLPVDSIESGIFSPGHPRQLDVSFYEFRAYDNGHDTKLWRIYGCDALMLFSAAELAEAEALLMRNGTSVDLKTIGEMAKFKKSSMSPAILLALLNLGYAGVQQLRAAGEILGIGTRRGRYFDLVLAEGADLARQAADRIRGN